MLKIFLKYCLLFFLPVVMAFLGMEALVIGITEGFQLDKELLNKERENIKIMIMGSSQMQFGVNPEWIDPLAVNLASGNQHHDTDFKLLKGILPSLPNVHTVILEVSYSHFELPHNGPDFWKNSYYLKYYDVNCFERPTYFKDRLLYLSNTSLLSSRVYEQYIERKFPPKFNRFGFNQNDAFGQFSRLDYNKELIDQMKNFKINKEPNLQLFEHNTTAFFEMLDYLEKQDVQVILTSLPMYPTYLKRRHPSILKRRNSVLQEALDNYDNIRLFQKETDTLPYSVTDFYNQSHLSLQGAEKFTTDLNSFILKN